MDIQDHGMVQSLTLVARLMKALVRNVSDSDQRKVVSSTMYSILYQSLALERNISVHTGDIAAMTLDNKLRECDGSKHD